MNKDTEKSNLNFPMINLRETGINFHRIMVKQGLSAKDVQEYLNLGIDPCETMKPWTEEEIRKNKAWISAHTCEDLCTAKPFWSSNPESYELSEWTDYLKQFYMVVDKNNDSNKPNEIRWDRIHGWKRRVLRTKIHNSIRKLKKYVDTWNKYCGRKDVLRIHARIGGTNWSYYGGAEVSRQPWFIEKVDDYFDSTYCDIYVRVKTIGNVE